jgi:predicted TIM-barrel fold metal-dependent hydrolase
VVQEPDGDWWYVDGLKTLSFAVLGIDPGHRFTQDASEFLSAGPFADVRPAAYDPSAYLAENEQDGIWGSVIYPSEGLIIFSIPDSEVVSASARAYNDWLAEFCSHDTARLKGVAMINLDDIPQACEELARCRQIGLCGGMITVAPPSASSYRNPDYDRFWATAQDLQMPLSLHVATARTVEQLQQEPNEVTFINEDEEVRRSLAEMIFSGVFERFPKLMVGAIEYQLGWIPYFLEKIDSTYKYRRPRADWHRFGPGVLPSDFFHANIFASFQEDGVGLRERHTIGVDRLMWGSDYPHRESTFPRSQEILADNLAGVSTDEVVKIVSSNAADFYHFNVPAKSQ